MTMPMGKQVSDRYHISIFEDKEEAQRLRLVLSGRRAWGRWLYDAFNWHHFATLTFAYEPTTKAVLYQLKRWLRYLERRTQGPVGCFYAIERSPAGRLHAHVLLSGTQWLLSQELERGWQPGRADASVYDPQRPGSYYISKDIGLSAEDWDFLGSSKAERKLGLGEEHDAEPMVASGSPQESLPTSVDRDRATSR
jgi:hypothetical protein